MRFSVKILLLFLAAIHFQTAAHAQIKLPKVFGDSMVLQRELKIPVWGISTPGATIIAELGNTKATIKAGGPYTLSIYKEAKPGEGAVLSGILVGDVWLASGQSNMEWQVEKAKDASVEIA